MPGIQTMIPILIRDGLLKRNWDLSAVVRFTRTRCAQVFGIYSGKGTICVGAGGDLAVIDPRGHWTVRAQDLFYKQRWSALEPETLDGKTEHPVVRGRFVYTDGEIKVPSGYGEFIMPVRRSATSSVIQLEPAVV